MALTGTLEVSMISGRPVCAPRSVLGASPTKLAACREECKQPVGLLGCFCCVKGLKRKLGSTRFATEVVKAGMPLCSRHLCMIARMRSLPCVRHDISLLSHLAMSKDRLVPTASKELGTAMHLLLTFGHWAVQVPMTIALSVQAEKFLLRP